VRNFRYKWLMFIPVLLVYALGLPVDVMEVDAAQYAEISREMLQTGNYLELYCRNLDYLDKPPFVFWTAALSYSVLGISDIAYKLPSLLFALLGIYSTWRLGRRLYGETAGFAAAFILSTTQAWFQFTNDVRTDTILSGAVIFAIWQLKVYLDDRRWTHLLGSAVGISVAMLTKGPIGLMVPVLGLGTDLLLKRDWKNIFRWQWLAFAMLVLVALSPMLWGLYQQFDLHPGKEINGQEIRSGLRFYLWTQSFGRLTGESKWSNDPSVTGFLPVLGWAFLPWTLLLAGGLWKKTKEIFSSRFRFSAQQEFISWGGFVFPFIALSLSHYKLPHYIFVLFPLGAILSAAFLAPLFEKSSSWLKGVTALQLLLTVVYTAAAGLLLFFVFPSPPVWKPGGIFLFLCAGIFAVTRFSGLWRFLTMSAAGAIVFNAVMNLHFYPELLKYQSPSVTGRRYAEELRGNNIPLTAFHALGYSLDFYSQQTITYHEDHRLLQKQFSGREVWVYTDDKGLRILRDSGMNILREIAFSDYRITLLKPAFLDPRTRSSTLMVKYMVLVSC